MKESQIWSKFLKCIKNEKGIFKDYETYYMGNLSNIDLTTDLRFNTNENRKQSIFLGLELDPFKEKINE